MLKVVKAKVVSDISPNEDGSFWAETGRGHAVRVAYTSPSYNPNQGGIFAPPTIDSEVMLFEDTSPEDNKPSYFYVATIVDDPPTDVKERIPEFKGVRAGGDGEAYNKDKRPVKMTLQNSDGQGISTTSDLSNDKRINHTSLDAETGAYISAGEQGSQMMNEHLDGIAVQGESNGLFPYRSISMTSDGPIFQESGASINLSVGTGGDDINISNCANSFAVGGGGLSAGNVRIHSQNKDITLRTGSPLALNGPGITRNINIITPGAEIQVNGQTGGITIRSLGLGGLNLESATQINLTSPLININGVLSMGGAGMSVSEDTFTVDMPFVNINGQTQANFQSNIQANINSPNTTVQGESVRVHSKAPVPPQMTYQGSQPIEGLSFGVAPGAPATIPPASLVPLPDIDPTTGIPGTPSVVVPNTYGDSPLS